MDWLQSMLDNSEIPLITAFLLGLITAINPCPLATNIAAIGFIGRNVDNKRRVFINGLLYTLGRTVAYTLLGIVLLTTINKGADTFCIEKSIFASVGVLLPPLMIIVGVLLLFVDKMKLPGLNLSVTPATSLLRGSWGCMLLGMLFAMSFCPTSALLYFGMLIPMAAAEGGGWLLPIVFAIGTGLPVVLVSWLLAYSMSSVGRFYNAMKSVQAWLNIVVALVFILVGFYYGLQNYGVL